ncbi:TIR domain-containing protein [Parafrankia irregularis]|uniref:TIR domain-containing protein n=1 Tax=Parafrankia irregularis TaxID=795642 RepID=UPI000B126AA9|nr:TIR domain-containing protein [Parafrankia irregularis]
MSAGGEDRAPDFYVSYEQGDQAWAEWIAWTLEDAGWNAHIRKWDIVPGAHSVHEADRAIRSSARMIAVLSNRYLASDAVSHEWQAAFDADRTGRQRRLLLFRIEDCKPDGHLARILSVDLFGISRLDAVRRIESAVAGIRAKPDSEPTFPGVTKAHTAAGPREKNGREEPTFPAEFPRIEGLAMPADFGEIMDRTWERSYGAHFKQEVPDVIKLADYRHSWLQVREDLLERLGRGYSPSPAQIINFPKSELHFRPIARMNPLDQVVYESLIYYLAPKIEKSLSKNVCSDRWDIERSQIRRPVSAWLEMRREIYQSHRKNPAYSLGRIDVSSFFESIQIKVLVSRLRASIDEPWVLANLSSFLEYFSALNGVRGIPQGPPASGIIANVYLLPIDSYLTQRGVEYWRFSDDITLLGDSLDGLRQVVRDVARLLSSMGMALAPQKSKVVNWADVESELEGAEKDAINYGIATGDPRVGEKLEAIFDDSIKHKNDRDTRYSLTRLKTLNSDYAVASVLDQLVNSPHMVGHFLTYLRAFYGSDIEDRLIATIEEGGLKHDDYAESQILLTFLRKSTRRSKRIRTLSLEILSDLDRQGYVREFAARLVGKHCDLSDGDTLLGLYSSEPDRRVARAIIVAIHEAGQVSRQKLLAAIFQKEENPYLLLYMESRPAKIPIP